VNDVAIVATMHPYDHSLCGVACIAYSNSFARHIS